MALSPAPSASTAAPDPAPAYARCRSIARRHYENFPVASAFLPRHLRDPVAAVYAFARGADDFADEPQHAGSRLARLDEWGNHLKLAAAGEAGHPVFIALADTLRRYQLPLTPFENLLSAFRQDAVQSRYETWEEVLDYCRRSADPIGRILLGLCGRSGEDLLGPSDALCTALQLTNFWQDLAIDAGRGRLYVPRQEQERFAVREADLISGAARGSAPFVALMGELADRTEALYRRSLSLPRRIGGGLGFQVRWTWLGGRQILERTRQVRFDVYDRRPSLGGVRLGALALRACLPLAGAER
jgi:phytoene synthase